MLLVLQLCSELAEQMLCLSECGHVGFPPSQQVPWKGMPNLESCCQAMERKKEELEETVKAQKIAVWVMAWLFYALCAVGTQSFAHLRIFNA